MSAKKKVVKKGISSWLDEINTPAPTSADANRARIKALQKKEEQEEKLKKIERDKKNKAKREQILAKNKAAREQKSQERNRKNLDKAGIKGEYDPNNPEHKKLWAKFKTEQNKIKERAYQSRLKSSRQISSHKKTVQEPITSPSQEGMRLPAKGETTKRKYGGKITYKMTGGQVVDAGYD